VRRLEAIEVTPARIRLDRCSQHGTWFDRGEIERVSEAYERLRAGELVEATVPFPLPPPTVHAPTPVRVVEQRVVREVYRSRSDYDGFDAFFDVLRGIGGLLDFLSGGSDCGGNSPYDAGGGGSSFGDDSGGSKT
jgi:Zn-finger nucleic acid-binding protein